jgi:hypothetical protein
VAARPAVKQADSLAATQAAARADAAVSQAAVVVVTLAALWCDGRKLRRTLNPKSSCFPPFSVF